MRTVAMANVKKEDNVFSMVHGPGGDDDIWALMSMSEAQKAYKQENPNAVNKYLCVHCDKKLRAPSKLSTHVKDKHMGWKHPCANCTKSFKSASALNTHTSSGGGCSGLQKFPCLFCDNTFTTKWSRDNHTGDTSVERGGACSRLRGNKIRHKEVRNASLNSKKSEDRQVLFLAAKSRLKEARAASRKKYNVFLRESKREPDHPWLLMASDEYKAAKSELAIATKAFKLAKKKYSKYAWAA